MIRNFWAILTVIFALGAIPACTTTQVPGGEEAPAPELAKAQALYEKGDFTAAMIACVDLAHENPNLNGLEDLEQSIMTELEAQRAAHTAARAAATQVRMDNDAARNQTLPDTYGLRRAVSGQFDSLRTPDKAMQKTLQKKVTIHLDNVDLTNFILTIGDSEKVNIIADNFAGDKTVTIHADQVPLGEILDYVARNLGIAFYVGDNIIWATPQEQGKQGIPMETRMYRLRKGIDGTLTVKKDNADEGNGEGAGRGAGKGARAGAGAGAAEPSEDAENVKIVQAIQRFIPQPEGADLLFDDRSHALIVKNTVENLARVEDIIETMDVCPPQVQIEARFIQTEVTDLRELGIDWVLNSPLAVSRSAPQNPTQVYQNQTQIAQGGTVGFNPFPNVAQGMNLTYQGVLTQPQFNAVLHALETTGNTRTLSVPKVTTVNNRTASIRVGEDFRYYDEYNVQSVPSQVVAGNANTVYSNVLVPVGTPKLEELGIQLTVRPSVGADMSSITLQLIPEISDFVRYEYFQTGSSSTDQSSSSDTNGLSQIKLPIFSRSKIETEMIVQSGETVVMGGLITSSESKTKNKVPFLSSIPLIGLLFQNDAVDNSQKNLLIFVTATLISERGENLIPLAVAKGAGAATAPTPPVAVTKGK